MFYYGRLQECQSRLWWTSNRAGDRSRLQFSWQKMVHLLPVLWSGTYSDKTPPDDMALTSMALSLRRSVCSVRYMWKWAYVLGQFIINIKYYISYCALLIPFVNDKSNPHRVPFHGTHVCLDIRQRVVTWFKGFMRLNQKKLKTTAVKNVAWWTFLINHLGQQGICNAYLDMSPPLVVKYLFYFVVITNHTKARCVLKSLRHGI